MSSNTFNTESTPPSTSTTTGFATPTRTSPSKHQPTTKTTPPYQQQQRNSLSSPTPISSSALPPKLSPFRHGRLLARTSPRSASNPNPSTMHNAEESPTPSKASHHRRPSTITLAEDVRRDMDAQAKEMQVRLLDLVERIEASKAEFERLESGNGFLQSYIGELMQTSRVVQQGGKKRR